MMFFSKIWLLWHLCLSRLQLFTPVQWMQLYAAHLMRLARAFIFTGTMVLCVVLIPACFYPVVKAVACMLFLALTIFLMRPSRDLKNWAYLLQFSDLGLLMGLVPLLLLWTFLYYISPWYLQAVVMSAAAFTFCFVYDSAAPWQLHALHAFIQGFKMFVYNLPLVLPLVGVSALCPGIMTLVLVVGVSPVWVMLYTLAIHEEYELYYGE